MSSILVQSVDQRMYSSDSGDTVTILGTTLSAIGPRVFIDRLEQFLASDRAKSTGAYVVFRDVHGLIRARELPELAAAHRGSLMNALDGMPLVWLARLAGYKQAQRVCGPETMAAVCAHGVAKGWRHVLFGSAPDTLEALRVNLDRQFPGVQIVDAISPPFRQLTEEETRATMERMRAARPDFIWVGLGSPKQELWMADHAASFVGAISMGVGAAFDMHAGRVKRAPRWMQPLGLEWMYRLAREPKRLMGRYAHAVPRFIWLVAWETALNRLSRI